MISYVKSEWMTINNNIKVQSIMGKTGGERNNSSSAHQQRLSSLCYLQSCWSLLQGVLWTGWPSWDSSYVAPCDLITGCAGVA